MRNVRLLIAYDGTNYLGWQKTSTGPSIEGSLEIILSQILQQHLSLQAASRTDAGVHAHGQVVNFLTENTINLPKLKHALNALLPKDIVVLEATEAALDFHPTLGACEKEYHYRLCTQQIQMPRHRLYAWHYPHSLDLAGMSEASIKIMGTHDFAAFCNFKKNAHYESTVRTVSDISIELQDNGELLFIVRGPNFLYKMVRNIVGTLVYVGCGKLEIASIPHILDGKDRTQAGITAPAHGLALHKVYY